MDFLEQDCRKLNAEVTQMVNQRFQITLGAIVAFSAVCGWLTPRVIVNDQATLRFVISVSVLLFIVLGMFFWYFHSLLGTMRIFTSYINVKYGSNWEADWEEYRHDDTTKKYPGYSVAARFIFLTLGFLSFAYPQALLHFCPEPVSYPYFKTPFVYVGLICLAAYMFFVFVWVARRHKFIREGKMTDDWRRVIEKVASTGAGSARNSTPR